MRKAFGQIGVFVVVMALILPAASYFGNHTDEVVAYFDETGWFGHNRMTVVASHAWAIGEYKLCTSAHDGKPEQIPILDCGGAYEDDKTFLVRFYGPTLIRGNQPPAHYGFPPSDTGTFNWECRRDNTNDPEDPAITCERAKASLSHK